MPYDLDDAAARALALLQGEHEQVGLLYEQDGQIVHTAPQGQGRSRRSSGRFEIPAGSLRGIYHSHPPEGVTFSRKDIETAIRLGVPSYIAVGNQILRYDPRPMDLLKPINQPGVDVLAMIPIQELIMAMARDILGRAPNDPRGLRKEGPTPQVSSDELRELPEFDPVRPQTIKPRRILANR